MSKFMMLGGDGFPTAFYSDDVHGARERPVYGDAPEPSEDNPFPARPVIGSEVNPDCAIPASAVEISDEQWDEFISNNGRRKWVDGQIVEYEPPVLPPVIPQSASRLGLIRAFKEQGVWVNVKAMIAADVDVQEEWDAATEIRRSDPITQGMIAVLHLTDAQVDALLIRANELVA